MSGFNYLINLTVVNGGAFDKLASMAGGFESKLDAVHGEIGQTERKLNHLGNNGRGVFEGLKSSVGGWIAGLGIAAATLGSLSTAADVSSLDTAITFAGGKEGAANLAAIEQTVNRLNTPIMAAKEGFKILSGSMIGTNITAMQQRDIFDSVAVASRVMGLSADNTTGAILALGQMASKGKVQAEELRGQLGERIPGAFGIAARAMGVTTAELDKMMEQGKLVAEDFLPKFAAEMQKTFGPGLAAAMDSPRAKFDQFSNSVLQLKDTIGNALMPAATALISNVLVPLFNLIGNTIPLIVGIGSAMAVWTYWTQIQTVWAAIATVGTWSFTGAMAALNAMFLANPVGFVIAGFMALAGAITWAWQKSEGFRGFLFGMWETIKTFGSMLIDRFVKPVIAAFQILRGAWNGSTEQIQSGMQTLQESANSWSKDFGTEMSNGFDRGWNNGITNFRGAQSGDVVAQAANATGGLGGATLGNGNAPGDKNKDKAKEISTGITGGGQRNITINVSKLTGVETLHTVNLKEGADRVGEELLKKLLQLLNGANQLQNG